MSKLTIHQIESDGNDSNSSSGSDYDSDSDSDASSDSSSTPRKSHHKSARPGMERSTSIQGSACGRKEAEQAKAKQLADKRRKKEVNLNKVTSKSAGGGISSGGGISAGSNVLAHRQQAKFTCHRCGEPGHKAVECKSSIRNPSHRAKR